MEYLKKLEQEKLEQEKLKQDKIKDNLLKVCFEVKNNIELYSKSLPFEFQHIYIFKKDKIYYKLYGRLHEMYLKSFDELSISKKKCDIDESYLLFPKMIYKNVDLNIEKKYDFTFVGSFAFIINKNVQNFGYNNRKWVIDFAKENFTENSFFVNTSKNTNLDKDWNILGEFDKTFDEESNVFIFSKFDEKLKNQIYFNKEYYDNLSKSKFCLCPAGDCLWSIRFIECIMCKCIPIVNTIEETYRSEAESKLDYKYYLTSSPEFIYREDWVEHNLNIFLKYHTLEYYLNKIFIIGFNKTGTTSLDGFFNFNSIPSAHWDRGNLAKTIKYNYENKNPLLKGYEKYTVFSDMEDVKNLNYAHVEYFKEFYKMYPNSKFILNIRNVDNWIKSRCNHNFNNDGFKINYLEMVKSQYNLTSEQVIEKWKNDFNNHVNNVIEYFSDKKNKLIIFDIEKDSINEIIDFLPELELNGKYYGHLNKGKQ